MRGISFIVLAGAIASSARADFISSFDSYAPGQSLTATDNWKAWDNVFAYAGVVDSSFSYSGSNALRVGTAYTDAVRLTSGASSGSWTFSTQMYLASGQTGSTYVILMNTYADGGNNNSAMWSSQLNFDLSHGTVRDDFRGGSVAIAFNQWSNVTIDIDLDHNTIRQYYNGTLIASGTWTTGASSRREIAAVDLYTRGGNIAHYDDVSLASVPTPGVTTLAGLAGLVVVRARRREAA
ncbi:MAG: hypothetical protein WC718_14425 [Phycisphaerales bacterium]|jgi:hypothetical protein